MAEPGIDRGSAVIAEVVGGIGILIILILTSIFLYRRRKRRWLQRMQGVYNANMGYSDSAPAPAPTLESIHQQQPWMTTEVNEFAGAKRHDLDEVPLDDDHEEDDDETFDERSTTCSYSPSDDTPTVTNVNYQLGFECRSLSFSSARPRSSVV
jgi:hypothetical protein